MFLRFRGVAKTPDIHAVIQDSEHFTIETITDAATFDAKHIWEQASERPAHATQWPIAVIEVTMKTKPSETTTIHTELIVDAKVPGYEHYVIPIEARIVSVD